MSLLLLLSLAACSREATPVAVSTDLGPSLARPLLNAFAAQEEATIDQTRPEHAAVLWQRDPEAILRLAGAGTLAALPANVVGERPAVLIDPERRWAASAAVARVLVYDPQRLADADAPTRVLDLARPGLAAQLVLTDPTRGAASWHAAALCARLGEAQCVAFYRGLRAGGAQVVADEEAVVAALGSGARSLALLDSDRAYAAQAALPRLVITVPDQEADGSGVFVLPWLVGLRSSAAQEPLAAALAAFLLAPPQAFQIALTGNALVVAGGETPPGLLDAANLRLMPVSYAELLGRLAAVRTALAS